ncbi:MAG TPA: hypothetical protein VHW24_01265 [Bryobacteraceae bacterium]|nr:hypothetical protein [Bryobacteraceae bacterium]
MNSSALRAACALAATALAVAPVHAQNKRHNLNVNFDDNANSCSELKVKTDGVLAQANDRFTLQGAPVQIDGGSSASIRVVAADRADYAVEACRFAVADDLPTAQQALAGTSVTRSAWRAEAHGPANAGNQAQWQIYLIVQAPRNGNVELTTSNGPISVRGVNGTVKAKAVNGPVSVRDCGGVVDAQTTNGPISFTGQGGDVKLAAVNGPLSVKLNGDVWNGPKLDASTQNGPVTLSAPDTFRSSVRLETSGQSPFTCKAAMCASALTDARSEHRSLQMNGSADTVHVSTNNGPMSVNGPSAR